MTPRSSISTCVDRPPSQRSRRSPRAPRGWSSRTSERHRVIRALREREVEYRSWLDGLPVGLYRSTPEGQFLDVNPALVRILGYPDRATLLSVSVIDTHEDPEDRRRWQAVIERQGVVQDHEVLWRRRDGSLVWLKTSDHVVRDADGHVRYYEGVVEDITERKRAEEALRESERRYRLLADNVSDVIWVFDLSLRPVYLSPSIERFRGYTVEETLAQRMDQRLTPASLWQVQAALAEEGALESSGEGDPHRTRTLEVELPCKDGSTVWAEMKISLLRDAEGRTSGFLGVSRDITARRQKDQQLHLQAAALDAAANAMVITDRDGIIRWVNPAFTSLTGYAADEVVGQTPRILKSGQHDRAFYEGLWGAICAGQVWHGEVINRRRDGRLYTERETITPVRDAQGVITHFIAIKRDVTADKQAAAELARQRETLYQTEKVAAMGQLLAGVAHELNNPLAVVVGQAHLLQQQAGDSPLAKRGQQIGQAAERCARIVKNFLALARQYPPEREEVRINHVVRETAELLAYPLRVDTVQVVFDLAEDLPRLWADSHQLQQVIVNLVTNAHQAMREGTPQGRQLSLTTRPLPDGAGVRLEVTDTGLGMAPEIQRRVFEPFFTTKPPGQGTGLGLSLCQGIVESHGGLIGVESQPGQGARFWVEWPVGTKPSTADIRTAEARPVITGKAILVVDDEAEVADLVAELLVADGHQADHAANGREALDRLRARSYDLILSDLRMPELDGLGLYRALEARAPESLRGFIFMTGDTLNTATKTLIDATGLLTLSKPFTAEEVRRVVQRGLGRL